MEGSILRKWAYSDSFKPDKTFRNSVSATVLTPFGSGFRENENINNSLHLGIIDLKNNKTV